MARKFYASIDCIQIIGLKIQYNIKLLILSSQQVPKPSRRRETSIKTKIKPNVQVTCCTAVTRATSSCGFHRPKSFVDPGAGAFCFLTRLDEGLVVCKRFDEDRLMLVEVLLV